MLLAQTIDVDTLRGTRDEGFEARRRGEQAGIEAAAGA